MFNVLNMFSQEIRVDLPDGWTFTSRILGEDLKVEDQDGIATVVTDDLRNTCQLAVHG